MGTDVRVAIIDIGTNSARLLVADVDDGRVAREVERHTTVTRLGARVDADGSLRDDAIARVNQVVDEYAALIERHRADRAHAILTSAVRDSSNGPEFAAGLEQRHRLTAHILTGDQEARLTYLGATDDSPPEASRSTTLVIDIGGGSTELVIGEGQELQFHVSTQAGVVRQAERHLAGDPPSPEELEAIAREVREIIFEAVPPERRVTPDRAIAVAGTPTSLAAIAQKLDPYDPAKVHGYVLSALERSRIMGELRSLPLEERRQTVGLDPARAPAILPGIVILTEVMELFSLNQVVVSEHDILRGAAMSLSAA